jgi:hypothetical protein
MSGSSMKDRLKNASSTFAHTAHARDPVMWNCRRLNEIRPGETVPVLHPQRKIVEARAAETACGACASSRPASLTHLGC